jgi:branched-chain amino acid transport system ATP-binding protein
MSTLLRVSDASAGYAGRPVIHGCSLELHRGQIVGVVGRNGAGKTTLVSAISGRLPLMGGTIELDGRPIGRLPAFRRSRLGMVHVPQGREVFASLTVEENLRIADRSGDAGQRALVLELFPVLRERLRQDAGTLSGGEQQMLAISRAILTGASLILLDEPSLGLAPKVVQQVFSSIERLRSSTDVTILLVEQQARWMWRSGMVDHLYVIEAGAIVASGTPSSLSETLVQDAYLEGSARS